MKRILAIDYGRRRCGVAVTDILQIAANGLPTVRTCDLMQFLKEYIQKEEVERIIVGLPRDMMGNPSESMKYITPFLQRLGKEIPTIPVEMYDERFTSVIAHKSMLEAGLKKSRRQDKGLADQTAAVIILTDWLNSRGMRMP